MCIRDRIITLEGIYAGRKKETDMIDIDTVKSMYEFSSPTIQEIVRNDMGNPDTWPEQISEQEYDRIVGIFESASERE